MESNIDTSCEDDDYCFVASGSYTAKDHVISAGLLSASVAKGERSSGLPKEEEDLSMAVANDHNQGETWGWDERCQPAKHVLESEQQ